ncbi:MAG: hypothetical protein AAGA70_09110 [Pseudomonadota bacterium]
MVLRIAIATAAALAAICAALPAAAHVSEQGLVLLLPTEHYRISGVLAVVASILLISMAPKSFVTRLFRPIDIAGPKLPIWVPELTSLVALICFFTLVWIGVTGPRDPLTNLFPLMIWVGFWIILFSVIGLSTDLWRFVNPWTGLCALLFGRKSAGLVTLPTRLGATPALAIFIAFCSFYVVDPAPADPDRLAVIAMLYWVLTLAAMAVFGASEWMRRGEAFAVLFRLISRNAAFGHGQARRVGMPGWDLLPSQPLPLSLGLFAVVILGVGSFDGLKETFWWLAIIGVNPLEFPGRSFVITSSLIGLALSSVGLIAVFASALWLGSRIAQAGAPDAPPIPLALLLRRFAPSILPIALAYHMSHFLITFLVDGQYLLAAIGDPLANGSNLFGLGQLRVTTGFLNTTVSVRAIWLTQAGIVVLGHILAVLVSHHAALTLFQTPRRAALSQIPIATFMVGYTFFGLWLLAAPRGI